MPRSRQNPKRAKRTLHLNGPPQHNANITFNHAFRFSSTVGTKNQITVGSLVGCGPCCGVGANLVAAQMKAFRIRQVRIWSPPPSVGGSVACALEWLSADAGVMTNEESNTSNNPSIPAFLASSPPSSTAAWYIRSVSNIGGGATVGLFNIRAPPGSVIELQMEVWLNDTLFTGWQIATTAAATVGESYYGGLDGIGAGTGLYPPVELYTIV